jgi:hypothetical protein
MIALQMVHMIEQVPAILLWQSAGYSASENYIKVPVIGCEFF